MEISLGFWSILGLIVIAAKLFKFINWPWKWILLPLWGPFVLGFIGWIIIIAGAVMMSSV